MFCAASIGITHGGGAGKYMAQQIVHGDSEINMLEFEPRRYMSWVNKDYSIEKSKEQYRRMYVTPMPHDTVEAGRPMKTSGIYKKLKDQGAEYYDLYGWEKPAWFNKENITEELSYRRNNIHSIIQKECEHVSEHVGIIDLSTFSKYEITGEDSFTFLDRLCSNIIPKKNGFKIVEQIKTANYIETVFKILTAYLYHSMVPKGLRAILTLTLIAPLNILGIFLGKILPSNKTFYLNNIMLCVKIK